MHQELSDCKLEDELVVPSNTRVYSIAKVREIIIKFYSFISLAWNDIFNNIRAAKLVDGF